MSTAQQLGLIGNSIKVQSLPTASAETFGAGNRFYTLIGQQEGYITGHTYHTIVANDVYSWEDVAGGNYNMLDNIPVINQDLSASGFTPVANTYYRHTGATTDTFTQGVIYLYDTAYHKLGESGGGTTLNKYTAVIHYHNDNGRALVSRILQNAKSFFAYDETFRSSVSLSVTEDGYVRGSCVGQTMGGYLHIGSYEWSANGALGANIKEITFVNDSNNNVTMEYKQVNLTYSNVLHLTYYNDTEIT